MAYSQSHAHQPKKSSTPWDRLRPVKQDTLEAMGFVSKGDNRLLDPKTQELFYHKIVDRYMKFCSHHSQNLEQVFASLQLDDNLSPSLSTGTNSTNKPPINSQRRADSSGLTASRWASAPQAPPPPALPPVMSESLPPVAEFSSILMALRKLREGLLATASSTASPVFSQRVHVFNIRAGILALHPPSYHPSLSYLLFVLHSKENPLPPSELREMVTYMILDRALRQNDFIAAFALRHRSKKVFDYENRNVDVILQAAVTGNWVAFWRVRRRVDGHVRALMHWHLETLRKTTLKTFARGYMKVDQKWLLKSVCGNEMNWEGLVEKEGVGWSKDGDTITIRKPKARS